MGCTAHVNTSMPFETFMLMVNGEQRQTYYMKQKELVTITTGIGPGDHTIVFRVKNAEFDSEMKRMVSQFGTGRIWLDDCAISSTDGLAQEDDLTEKTDLVTEAASTNTSHDPIGNADLSESAPASPTEKLTDSPIESPTASPTDNPTDSPTNIPISSPTEIPIASPTESPTPKPNENPTDSLVDGNSAN